LLERIQYKYTKMIKDMRDRTYEDRLKCLRLQTLEERHNRQDLVEVFKMYKGYRPSSVALQERHRLNSKGTRGHSCKLMKARCTKDITRYFFSNKVINRWNVLEQSAVDASSINAFKNSLENVRSNRMGFFMD